MIVLDKACQQIEHLGLTLAEAKQLLATLQHHLLERQATGHCQLVEQLQGVTYSWHEHTSL
jgi:hypothetical protein